MIGHHRLLVLQELDSDEMKAKTLEAVTLMAQMLVEQGLGDWHMHLKRVKSYHAQVRHDKQLVTWNLHSLRRCTKEEFIGITYHEIAHVLVGKGHGHDRVFKLKYHELTGNWDHARWSSKLKNKTFRTECPVCHTVDTTEKRGTRYCRPCSENNNKIELNVTPTGVIVWRDS